MKRKCFYSLKKKTKIKNDGYWVGRYFIFWEKYLDRPIDCVGIKKYGLRSLVLFFYIKNIVPI